MEIKQSLEENSLKFEQRASGRLAYTLKLNFKEMTEKEIDRARELVDYVEQKFKDIIVQRKEL